MSWSARYSVIDGVLKEEDVSNIELDTHKDQHHAALGAVYQILLSGVVGKNNHNYAVVLTGHGNPDHEPTPGWANDCVGINIYQLTDKEEHED